MNRQKRPLIIVGGCLAVLIGLGIALVVAFPAERVGRIAAARATAALDRDVGVAGIRFKLFPAPAVALEGVTVARRKNSEPRDTALADSLSSLPLATIARVEIRPRLLPLLRGDVVVNEIVIESPTLVIETDTITAAAPETPEGESSGFWDDATLQIRRIRLRNGTVEYRNASTGGTAHIEDLDVQTRLDGTVQDGRLATLDLAGNISMGGLSADLPAKIAVPVHDLRVGVAYDATLDLASENATIDDLALTVQEATIEGSGSIRAWSDPAMRRLSLQFQTSEADIPSLLASLPANLRSWPANSAAGDEWTAEAGRAGIEMTVDGPLGNGALPDVDGLLTLDGVALSRGGDAVVTDLDGRISFSRDSASTTAITASLLGEPQRLAFSLRDFARPVLDASVTGSLNLSRAQTLGLFPEGWKASGAPDFDLVVNGPLKQPAELRVNGRVALAGLGLANPAWPAPVSVSAGTIDFDGARLLGDGLAAKLGTSDVALDFTVANWLPFALGDSTVVPEIAFDSRSTLVDLDELFPVDSTKPTYTQLFLARLTNSPVDGRSAGEAAEAAGLALPDLPRIDMEGRLRADRIVQRGATYQGVDARVAAREGQLELRSAELSMMGGAVKVAARLGSSADSTTAPLSLDFTVQEIQAAPFLQKFTAFRDRLAGTLGVDGNLAMTLDEHLLPEPASLSGGADLDVADGRMVNWPMVRALGEKLGIAGFDTISFRDWTGHLDVAGSRIVLGQTTLTSGDIEVRAAGSFDVTGQLDLAGTVSLGPSLTSRVRGSAASTLVAAASDSGRVPVGVRISGTTRQPSVALDLSEAGRNLATRAREEAAAKARELVGGAAKQVVGAEHIPPVTSPAEAIDSARQRIGNAVVGRLRGLLSPRATPNDTAAADSASAAADSAAVVDSADAAAAAGGER